VILLEILKWARPYTNRHPKEKELFTMAKRHIDTLVQWKKEFEAIVTLFTV